jgi:hypothetical protein
MCTFIRQVCHPRVCNGIDNLADTRKQRHYRDKAEKLALWEQIGYTALERRLEKVQKIVAYHTVKKSLRNIRKAVTNHFAFWKCFCHNAYFSFF